MDPEQIGAWTPIITTIITVVVGGVIVGLFARWNQKRGAIETKAPSVSELWAEDRKKQAELDIERDLRRWFQDAFWALVRAFNSYITRVANGGSTSLRAFERKALEAKPPAIDKE